MIHATPPREKRSPTAGTVLVTGSSSGIGLATVIAAARAGWNTIATVRDPDRAGRLRAAAAAAEASVDIDIRRLDVTDPTSIQDCVEAVAAVHGRLDAVVNNAGAAHVGTIESDDFQQFRDCVELNFFGVVQVTRAVMPFLRATRGRIVTVSSVGGVVGQPFNEAYCAAKFAVEGFCEALAPVAAAVGVRVTVVEPGAVASQFITNAALDPVTMVAAAGPYRDVVERYLDRTMKQFGTAAQPATEVADIIVGVLADPRPPLRAQTSDWSKKFVRTKLADLDGSAVLNMTGSWLT